MSPWRPDFPLILECDKGCEAEAVMLELNYIAHMACGIHVYAWVCMSTTKFSLTFHLKYSHCIICFLHCQKKDKNSLPKKKKKESSIQTLDLLLSD